MAYAIPSTQPTGTLITSTMWAQLVNNDKFFHGVPSAKARRLASGQSINTSTWNAVTFDTADWNTGGGTIFSTTSNAKFKTTVAGKYLVSATVTWTSSTAGKYRGVGIRFNTTAGVPKQGEVLLPAPLRGNISPTVTTVVSMTSTQFFQVVAFHDKGTALSLLASTENAPWCSVLWVSS